MAVQNRPEYSKAFSDGFIEQAVILFPDDGHGNDRNSQLSGESFRVDGNALSARHVHHVQDENGGDVVPMKSASM